MFVRNHHSDFAFQSSIFQGRNYNPARSPGRLETGFVKGLDVVVPVHVVFVMHLLDERLGGEIRFEATDLRGVPVDPVGVFQ